MFHDPHMLWIGAWIHHHSITSTFVGPDFESQLDFMVTAWLNTILMVNSAEALDPPRILETSMWDAYQMFRDPHMLWIGAWIYHHSITSAFICQDFESHQLESVVTATIGSKPYWYTVTEA